MDECSISFDCQKDVDAPSSNYKSNTSDMPINLTKKKGLDENVTKKRPNGLSDSSAGVERRDVHSNGNGIVDFARKSLECDIADMSRYSENNISESAAMNENARKEASFIMRDHPETMRDSESETKDVNAGTEDSIVMGDCPDVDRESEAGNADTKTDDSIMTTDCPQEERDSVSEEKSANTETTEDMMRNYPETTRESDSETKETGDSMTMRDCTEMERVSESETRDPNALTKDSITMSCLETERESESEAKITNTRTEDSIIMRDCTEEERASEALDVNTKSKDSIMISDYPEPVQDSEIETTDVTAQTGDSIEMRDCPEMARDPESGIVEANARSEDFVLMRGCHETDGDLASEAKNSKTETEDSLIMKDFPEVERGSESETIDASARSETSVMARGCTEMEIESESQDAKTRAENSSIAMKYFPEPEKDSEIETRDPNGQTEDSVRRNCPESEARNPNAEKEDSFIMRSCTVGERNLVSVTRDANTMTETEVSIMMRDYSETVSGSVKGKESPNVLPSKITSQGPKCAPGETSHHETQRQSSPSSGNIPESTVEGKANRPPSLVDGGLIIKEEVDDPEYNDPKGDHLSHSQVKSNIDSLLEKYNNSSHLGNDSHDHDTVVCNSKGGKVDDSDELSDSSLKDCYSCSICFEEFDHLSVVKRHLIEIHPETKPYCAVRMQVEKEGSEDSYQLLYLWLCPNNCVYFTPESDTLAVHVTTCVQAELTPHIATMEHSFSVKTEDWSPEGSMQSYDLQPEAEAGYNNGDLNGRRDTNYSSYPDKKFPSRCSVCGLSFNSPILLNKHMISFHAEKPYKCPVCLKGLTQKRSIKRHLMMHEGQRPFTCHKCSASFADNKSLKNHLARHYTKKIHRCNHCNASYDRRYHLYRHMKTHTGIKPYECCVCLKGFTDGKSLSGHMKQHKGEKPFKCRFCDLSFRYRKPFTNHMRTHTGEDEFECQDCHKDLSRCRCFIADVLVNEEEKLEASVDDEGLEAEVVEQESAKPEKAKPEKAKPEKAKPEKAKPESTKPESAKPENAKEFECNVCLKVFSNALAIRSHMKKHKGEKPHECSYCHVTFRYKKPFDNHLRKHTSLETFACQYCHKDLKGCRCFITDVDDPPIETVEISDDDDDEGFVRETELPEGSRESMLKSENEDFDLETEVPKQTEEEKLFECSICFETFTEGSASRRHMKQHKGEKPYRCKVCGLSFRYPKSFNSHVRRHTEENIKRDCQYCHVDLRDCRCILADFAENTEEMPIEIDNDDDGDSSEDVEVNIEPPGQSGDNVLKIGDDDGGFDFGTDVQKHIRDKLLKSVDRDKGPDFKTELPKHTREKLYKSVHLNKDLKTEVPEHTKEKLFKSIQTDSGSDSKLHLLKRRLPKQFQCNHCSASFRVRYHLRRHVTERHTEISKTRPMEKKCFECVVCFKSFQSNYSLTEHMRTHTQEKPFICIHCGHAFAQKSNHRTHIKRKHPWVKDVNSEEAVN